MKLELLLKLLSKYSLSVSAYVFVDYFELYKSCVAKQIKNLYLE